MSNRFDTVPALDRQIDRQTDGQTDRISKTLARDKNGFTMHNVQEVQDSKNADVVFMCPRKYAVFFGPSV